MSLSRKVSVTGNGQLVVAAVLCVSLVRSGIPDRNSLPTTVALRKLTCITCGICSRNAFVVKMQTICSAQVC